MTNDRQQTYDLIVIGGGVNGAGVARDGALRGLKTILLEKNDFASGTSSWSTRLIHGGLRYLEYFEFSLVRESLREREVLLQTAPHLVKPLLLTIPVYRSRSRPYWKIQAGMLLYDTLSYDKTLPPHRMLPKTKFLQLLRSIDPEDLSGGAQYYDGQVAFAERLCLETIISAAEAGATVCNYTEVTQLHRQGNRITHLSCRDVPTGEEFTVTGSDRAVIINTSGPWVDRVCSLGVENGESKPISQTAKIGGTKGSHIVVDPFPGALDSALYVEAKTDGRPFFIVPWLGMYLIGTTDLPYRGNLDRVKADDDEIDYLIAETNGIIPSAALTRSSVKFTYSGVRPLPNTEGKKPGSITRKHILFDHTSEGIDNLISLIGGKLTTYRHVGEELVDAAFRKIGRSAPPCPTLKQPLPGAILPSDDRIREAVQNYRKSIPLNTIDYLFSMYGSRAIEVLALTDKAPDLAEAIVPQLLDIKAQIVYAIRSEYAKTFVDINRRRTPIAFHDNYGFPALSVLAEVAIEHCGWTRETCDRLIEEYRMYMEKNCIPDYAIEEK
ncbi:MAG TPA: glycerol-3-phosphate dehydrogenase [Oscillatoriales cyanobacterium M59_W2019_021]|nr:glycerol-3-phosphate dehydrogenase [Oscillatoriales cyanobacterium M4454_W2019_049]HIK51989.1 glycerol-3-phosphate dehydrogenase [Oscillatoriales cyanobacterium M59_W2019_021]